MQQPEASDARFHELLSVLRRFEGRRLFVAVLGSPDPDGLSSAWALSLIARHVGVRMDILTFEVVSRPDNATFLRLLGIPFRKVVDRLPRAGYAGYAVVDRQNARLPVVAGDSLPLVAHVDHHAVVRNRALFAHQDPTCGSTATIMTQYAVRLFPDWSEDPELVRRVATALLYGIRTDTQDLLNANRADFEAAALLVPHVSSEWMRTLVQTPWGRGFLDSLGTALRTLQTQGGFTVAFAGWVARRARDSIGQVADFLIHAEGTEAVVVFGIVDGLIVGSFRTSNPVISPYEFLERAFADRFGASVDCGGRRFSGGFQVPLSGLADQGDDAIREAVTRPLFAAWGHGVEGRPRSRKKSVVFSREKK